MCNKMNFSSAADARQHVKNISSAHAKNKPNGKLYPYLCPECNKYHLTKEKKAKKYKRLRANLRKKV